MKKNISPLLFGIVFILAGLGYVGSAFFNWDFTIFFDGWWTLFIIIPSFISILSNGPRAFNVGAFLVGVLFLLSEMDPPIISSDKMWEVVVSVVIIYIGLTLIIKFVRGPKEENYNYHVPNGANSETTYTYSGGDEHTGGMGSNEHKAGKSYVNFDSTACPNYNAILSGIDAKNTSIDFQGAKISAIMGGVDLDLRDTIITKDITIYATAIMGGIDILAPQNVRISISKTDILGGTSCSAMTQPQDANVPIVTFICTTIMGGIDIK